MTTVRNFARAGAALLALLFGVGETQACWFGHGGTAAYRPTYAYYAPAPVTAYYAPAPTYAYYAPTYTAAYAPVSTCNTCSYAPMTTLRPTTCCAAPVTTYYAPSYGCSTCGSTCGGCDTCGSTSYVSGVSSGCSTCATTTTISNPTYVTPSVGTPTPAAPSVQPGPTSTFETRKQDEKSGPMIQVPSASPSDGGPMPGSKTSTQPGLFAPRTQDRTASLPVIRVSDSVSAARPASDLRPAPTGRVLPTISLND